MEHQTPRFRLHAGTASILLVFVTLCLVSFAVLTLVNANADLRLSEKIARRTSAYYEAVNEAETFIAETDGTLYELYKANTDEAAFLAVAKDALGDTLLNASYPLGETQALYVTLLAYHPDRASETDAMLSGIFADGQLPPDENRYGGNPRCLKVLRFQVQTDEESYRFEETLLNLPH